MKLTQPMPSSAAASGLDEAEHYRRALDRAVSMRRSKELAELCSLEERPSTVAQLIWLHEATAVELENICEKYLGLSPKVAKQRAALHTLPFPTFRLTDSAKAPIMVKVSDLARHIDDRHEAAAKSWEHSQT